MHGEYMGSNISNVIIDAIAAIVRSIFSLKLLINQAVMLLGMVKATTVMFMPRSLKIL